MFSISWRKKDVYVCTCVYVHTYLHILCIIIICGKNKTSLLEFCQIAHQHSSVISSHINNFPLAILMATNYRYGDR